MSRPRPYIGIAGVTKKACTEEFVRNLPGSARRAILPSIYVNSGTLRREANRYAPHLYPALSELHAICFSHMDVVNNVRFHSERPYDLAKELLMVWNHTGRGLQSIEIDNPWPPPSELEDFVVQAPSSFRIIIRLNEDAIRLVSYSPKKVAERLSNYDGKIEDVVIDRSIGNESLNIEAVRPYIEAIAEKYSNLGITVAGGITKESVNYDFQNSLIGHFPFLSLSAGPELVDDGFLNVTEATSFVKWCYAILEGHFLHMMI